MATQPSDANAASERPLRPVQQAAEDLRGRIFAVPPGARIGSLPQLAEALGVGIVTVQQAARVLEHEGLLEVRRGPSGGYYGRRPDIAALQRAIAGYARMRPASYLEALDLATLLFCELVAAAAAAPDDAAREELQGLAEQVDSCVEEASTRAFEERFQNLLFRMVDRPIFELLTRVALELYGEGEGRRLYAGEEGARSWRNSRRRVIAAILARDPELARFEAERTRRELLRRFGGRLARA